MLKPDKLNVQGKSGKEEEDGHEWECRKQKVPPTEGVDRPDRRKGHDKVESSEAPGGEKGLDIVEARLSEYTRGVIGNGVDTAELL